MTGRVEAAQAVLWYFGDEHLGVQPGSFVSRLLRTIAAADESNRRRLMGAYPEYVVPFTSVQRDTDGLDRLRQLVKQVAA